MLCCAVYPGTVLVKTTNAAVQALHHAAAAAVVVCFGMLLLCCSPCCAVHPGTVLMETAISTVYTWYDGYTRYCRAYRTNSAVLCVCCLHIKPISLTKDIINRYNQCPILHPREILPLHSGGPCPPCACRTSDYGGGGVWCVVCSGVRFLLVPVAFWEVY